MKKVLVAAILGLVTTAAVLGQGQIVMYNYGVNPVTYGVGFGALTGQNVVDGIGGSTWTFAMYGVAGDHAAAINSTFVPNAEYEFLSGVGGLTLGSGTAHLTGDGHFGVAFPASTATFNFTGLGTFVLVVYNGATYDSSTLSGHSMAFTETAIAAPSNPHDLTSGQYGNFSVNLPEPSSFALAGLGLASLLIFHRRK